MKNMSIAAALLISSIAGLSSTMLVTDGASISALAAPLVVAQDGSNRGQARSRDGARDGGPVMSTRPARRFRSEDCHRDVQTHRIRGRMVMHRHVGENCEVREVRRSGSALP